MSLPPPDLPPPDETPEPTQRPPVDPAPAEPAPPPRTGAYADPGKDAKPDPKKSSADEVPPSTDGKAAKLNSELIVSQITEAATFPIRGKGWPLMLPAVVLALVMSLVGWVPLLGWLLSIGAGIYFAAYFFRSLSVSMRDGTQPPEWPDSSKIVSDVVFPGGRMLLAALVSSIPAIILGWMDGEAQERGMTAGAVIGMAAFAMYFPMAALSITGRTGWDGVMPQHVIPAIQRCLPEYFVIAGGVFLADYAQEFVRRVLGWIPLVGSAGALLVYFFLMLVNARLIGLLYVKHRKAIGW